MRPELPHHLKGRGYVLVCARVSDVDSHGALLSWLAKIGQIQCGKYESNLGELGHGLFLAVNYGLAVRAGVASPIWIFMHFLNDAASTPQDGLSGSRVCECHILKRLNAPDLVLSRQHRHDQCIDLVWPGRVGGASRQATPEMYDYRAIRNLGDVDQLIVERSVAIDGFVDWNMERDNFIDAADIVAEAIYERRVFIEQGAQRSHVVSVPGGFECAGHILRPARPSCGVCGHSSLR
jgi:hypothetical protein